jgi:hypothetical protein
MANIVLIRRIIANINNHILKKKIRLNFLNARFVASNLTLKKEFTWEYVSMGPVKNVLSNKPSS